MFTHKRNRWLGISASQKPQLEPTGELVDLVLSVIGSDTDMGTGKMR